MSDWSTKWAADVDREVLTVIGMLVGRSLHVGLSYYHNKYEIHLNRGGFPVVGNFTQFIILDY